MVGKAGRQFKESKKVAKENEATHPEAVFVKEAAQDLCAVKVIDPEEFIKESCTENRNCCTED